MTIVEFLEARLAEDEKALDDALRFGDPIDVHRDIREIAAKRAILARLDLGPDTWDEEWYSNPENAMHEIERDRDHALACHLASVYADHPDYDEAWRP